MRLRVGPALSVLILACFDLLAAEYGPRTFVRQGGAPRVVVEQFERRVIADRYDLIITTTGVSSAVVWLNGAIVAGLPDFSAQRTSVRRPVAVRAGMNEVAVELRGAPGGTLTLRISAVIGREGGTVATGGASFTVPSGALAGDAEADLHLVAAEGVAAPLPYRFLAAVRIELDALLASEGTLAASSDAITGRGIVARVVPREPGSRLELVGLAVTAPGGILTAPSPMPGIRGAGTFVFLDMPATLGIAGIRAVRADGQPAAGTLLDALTEDASAFVGITGEDGTAAIPGMRPGTEVMLLATSPVGGGASRLTVTASAGAPLDIATVHIPTLPDIVAGGFAGAWLQNLVLYERYRIDPDLLPSAPPLCPCLVVTAQPPRIPVAGIFPPGGAEQLKVECGGNDVTSADFDLPTLLQGAQVQFTSYGGFDPDVIGVSADGLVTAEAPGRTSVWISTTTVQLYATRDPLTGRRIASPFHCWAAGRVDPVEVQCPAAGPHWNAAARRCHAQFSVALSGTGAGTVTLAPSFIPPCRSTCQASGVPATVVVATATADAGSAFGGWSSACSGSAATSSFVVQEGAVCEARFVLKGACCYPNGTCALEERHVCEQNLGAYRGDGVPCSPDACPQTIRFTLQSSRALGGTGYAIPVRGGTIKARVVVPGNMIRGSGTTGDCGRGDVRVELRVCPENAGCSGVTIHAGQGQGLNICHQFDEVLGPFEFINPTVPSFFGFNAITEKTSTVEVEITP